MKILKTQLHTSLLFMMDMEAVRLLIIAGSIFIQCLLRRYKIQTQVWMEVVRWTIGRKHSPIVFRKLMTKLEEFMLRTMKTIMMDQNLVLNHLLTVGSTAVVVILCQNHLIVANCSDSRAVLCRGKEALPLSSDHKTNREDEWAKIEAAGGRIIQQNGYRVLGILAVSRSIGDRYLQPWIIPTPEVKFVQREKKDECLILASDGLWDVMTNEEACEIARKRILLWQKKHGNGESTGPGEGVDPAAQYAAEYLSRVALQRGSKDNISAIVIDLKGKRKFKTKA